MNVYRTLLSPIISAAVLWAAPAQAAKLASVCTLKSMDPNAQVEGTNPNKRMPIASVSKVITAWWGVTDKGIDYRFPTAFHVTPNGNGAYNIHIQGSRDPYFGLESLHFAISELSKKGFTKVNRITFDENFKFFRSVTSSKVAIGFYNTSSPSSSVVLSQLKAGALTDGWANSAAAAKSAGINLGARPDFKPKTIFFRPSSEFKPVAETRMFTMRSAPLQGLLKEMNRNSNNHAANQIFEHLGGATRFKDRIKETLGLDENQIRFVNGSGDRADLPSGATYNEATCGTVLKVIRNLRSKLLESGKDLQDVMAVAGRDLSSTTSRIYGNDVTSGSLIAKTGTVSPNITLAGIIHTEDGDYYFMFSIATKGTNADWRAARNIIRQEVTKLIRRFDGGDPLKYTSVKFLSVDRNSDLIETTEVVP